MMYGSFYSDGAAHEPTVEEQIGQRGYEAARDDWEGEL
jgi:hypothetical protein